jgi:hypothetical protein
VIIYLHMHKCAGTSVIRSALASGLRLPAVHKNGNLLAGDGSPLKYRGMVRDDLVALLEQQIGAGVEFMAMEWDFPRWAMFEDRTDLRFFTTLREPLARAISNFKMDKVAGWIDRDISFTHYINGDALYRSDNYYVKILGQLWPKDTATPADLDHALAVLAQFEGVIVVEQGNMRDMLARFGIAPKERRFNTFDADAARAELGDDRHLWVSQPEIRDFIARNALDFALYRHFTRAIRLADRPTQKETAYG